MAVPTMAEMIGVYVLSEADMTAAVDQCGIRGDTFLRAMAPYATTANDVPVAIADYADTYTLGDAAAVNAVVNFIGPRGPSVFEQLLLVAA